MSACFSGQMTYLYSSIKSIELEISTYCNAACPQCPRNYYGGKIIESLPMINWSLNDLKTALNTDFVKQLESVYFCGTYGDAFANKNLTLMCRWLRDQNPLLKIGIHTNGGLGQVRTYQELAPVVDFIAFGIDGLEDTNHLYRRNVNWDTVMRNVKVFIDSGGYAIQDFIVFKHNQHQINEAKELSRQLGFKEFNIKKTSRFFNKSHDLVNSVDVLNDQGVKEYHIELPDAEWTNNAYNVIRQIDFKKYITDTNISCFWMNHNMLYIGADGYTFPCGGLHDRLYGAEVNGTPDQQKIYSMMEQAGGKHKANVFKTSLRDIVEGSWFKTIAHSWTNNRLERCAVLCGEQIKLLSVQNENISYRPTTNRNK